MATNNTTATNAVEEVSWDTEQLRTIVAKIESSAETLGTAMELYNSLIERIRESWEGKAATVFLSELVVDQSNLASVINNIGLMASIIAGVLPTYDDCESSVNTSMSEASTQLEAVQSVTVDM